MDNNEENIAKALEEVELEKINGGYNINGVEYRNSFKVLVTCPNCSCNGHTHFYTNEGLSYYECKTGVYYCDYCKNVWGL